MILDSDGVSQSVLPILDAKSALLKVGCSAGQKSPDLGVQSRRLVLGMRGREALLDALLKEVGDRFDRSDVGIAVAGDSEDSGIAAVVIAGLTHFDLHVSYHVFDRSFDIRFLRDWYHPHVRAGLAHTLR